MSDLVSNTHVIQVNVSHVCWWMMFVGLILAARAVSAAEIPFVRDLDILTIQTARSEAGRLLPYRIDTSVAFVHVEEKAPAGSIFNGAPRLHLIAEPKLKAGWPTSTRWQDEPDQSRISLTPILRFESKEERVEVRPQQGSIWVLWRRSLR